MVSNVSALAASPPEAVALIELRHVSRVYRRNVDEVHALEDASLSIARGRFVAFMGPSGSGKSTLLNLVSGIDRPSSGEVLVAGELLSELDEDALARWRARHVGLIFQFFNLVPVLTARENVALPLLLTRLPRAERDRRAEIALRVVGLEHRIDHSPGTLSGGEQQRVAIARAIVSDPDLIVADEPTGDLDAKNAEQVLDLLRQLKQEFGKTIVMVTHDPRALRFVDEVFHLDKGLLLEGEAAQRAAEALRMAAGGVGPDQGADGAMTLGRLVRANLRRNRLRSALTAGAIALAVMLVSVLLTMPAGLDAFLTRVASNTRISVVNKAGLVYSMPYAYARKMRALEGVADCVAMVWFGGAFEEEGRVTFPSFAVEADRIASVYPDYEIAPEALDAFRRYRDGAIIGRQTMRQYGWKVGERITLRSSVWPVKLDFRIVGEIPNDRSPLFWMNREYLDQALKAQGRSGLGIAGIVWVRVVSPDQVNPVMLRVDALTRNSDSETAAQTEKSFFANFVGSLEGFLKILMLVTGLVSLCIVFIAANTASMAVRERAGEIAVLRAIGFRRPTLFAVLLSETIALSFAAGATGVALATALTAGLRLLGSSIQALGPLGGFLVTPTVLAQGIGLSFAIGIVAGLAPAWGAVRRPVSEVLREVF